MKENKVENKDNVQLSEMLIGSSSPHIRTEESVQRIMLDVIIALIPALLGSIYFFGMNALKVTVISVAAAVITEVLMQKMFKKEVTVMDLSAVVTGILLAFNLPPEVPWYLPAFGSFFAIAIVKQCFGGIGQNFMNPALAGRAALMASWAGLMSGGFTDPILRAQGAVDAVSSATPLVLLGNGENLPALKDMFIGNIPGTIGETSALLLLIGAAYLVYRGVIDLKVPIIYIATTAVSLLILGVDAGLVIYHILAGGLILGAFFMATDYASIPVTPKGRVIFAIGAGFITAVIRVKGGYPEGVSYSILLMNVATPLIERFTAPKVFGRVE